MDRASAARHGRLGGLKTLERHGRAHLQRIGRQGGLATLQKYGRAHFIRIGKLGFQATVQKHWGGDRAAFLRRLKELGLMTQDPCPWNGFWQFPKRDGEPW